jgi:hypothetical protein
MHRRLVAATCLLAFVLSGCAGPNRPMFPEEVEAWGHELHSHNLRR